MVQRLHAAALHLLQLDLESRVERDAPLQGALRLGRTVALTRAMVAALGRSARPWMAACMPSRCSAAPLREREAAQRGLEVEGDVRLRPHDRDSLKIMCSACVEPRPTPYP